MQPLEHRRSLDSIDCVTNESHRRNWDWGVEMAESFFARARSSKTLRHEGVRRRRKTRRSVLETLEKRNLLAASWLDVDVNDSTDALSDGILFIRQFAQFSGAALTNGAVDPGGERTDPVEIENSLGDLIRSGRLDIDQNGRTEPLSDGILVIRYLAGFRGDALTDGAVDPNGQRTTAAAIESHLLDLDQSGSLGLFTLEETGGYASTETQVGVPVGADQGTRTVSVQLDPDFDQFDTEPVVKDLFQIYVVDPNDPTNTLLDRGENGTAVFSLSETGADFQPGVVRFDGSTVEIDVSNVEGATEADLRFQFLNNDLDNTSRLTVLSVDVTADPDALASPVLPPPNDLRTQGPDVDVTSWVSTEDVSIEVENIRYDVDTGQYEAELKAVNNGLPTTGNLAVAFPNLPSGVTIDNESGQASGDPFLNLKPALQRGGLVEGTQSASIPIRISNPNGERIRLVPTVLAGPQNQAPDLDAIGTLTVTPGETVELQLPRTDSDGDKLTYTLQSDVMLPTGVLTPDGKLSFSPSPEQIGDYDFNVIASDGAEQTIEPATLMVVADTVTTTRVSGFILNTLNEPLVSVPIELGDVQTTTAADGSFTVETAGTFTDDTLKIRGEAIVGSETYPFIAEKLHLVLGHDLYDGVNNQIMRPIYLPALDTANAQPIDPNANTTVSVPVRADELPVEVFVAQGTLLGTDGNPFAGSLSVTEVPPDLTPAALPPNLRPDLVLTIQPGEMNFTQPAPITFPNTAGYEPGSLLNLWSINPVTGDFDDVGDMQVSADGTVIETISGGINNSSWHFPTPPEPDPEPDDDGDEDDDCDECKETQGNFEVELHSGAVLEDHTLVSYQSIGQTQVFGLHYDSQRADPRPIVHLKYSNLVPRDNQRLVASLDFMNGDFQFMLPGYEGDIGGLNGGEHFWNLDVTGTGRVALQADLTMFPSGLYSYDLTSGTLQFDGEQFAGTTTTQTKELRLVNTINSPFGAGWGLTGLWEIVENADGSVLMIDGGGSELYFAPAANPGEPLVSPPGDFTSLVKLGDGTYQRTTKDQTVHLFNSNHQIASMTDRNGNVWTFEYDADDVISSITDPANLVTTFTTSDGRVTAIEDPANRITGLEYDSGGNLIRITDPDQTSRQWDYDESHRMTSHTDKRGFTEQVFYDFAGRAERSIRKDGTEQFYDPVQTQVLLPPERTIDPLDAPSVSSITEILGRYVDPNGSVTEVQLDKQGQAVSRIDAEGAINGVGRNNDNLIIRGSDGRGNLTTFGYDARGNVTAIRDTISGQGSSGISNQGTEFWLSFQQNNLSSASKSLFITSDTATSGTVEIPGLSFSEPFQVTPGQVTTVVLPNNVAVFRSDQVSDLGIHVTSEAPIAVAGLNQQDSTTDGFLALPSNVVGREYLVVSYPANGSHFAVTATQDDTELTIVPSVTTSGHSAGTPFSVTLNTGEVYYLQGTNDLTGSSISATDPVSVFSGHECGNVPPGVSACDHMVEQLTPVETWGTAFVTAPLATRLNGDTFRVVASADDTEITINGEIVTTLNRGAFFETILTLPSAISGTKPIAVAQYSNGQDFDNVESDPFMQLIPPVEQFDSVYTVATPAEGFETHFINVMIPTVGVDSLVLNGDVQDSTLFTQVAGTAFSSAQLPVEAGTHTLSSPVPFGMYIYGFGSFDSYGYLGGQTFSPVQQRTFTYDEIFNQLVLSTDELGREILQDLDTNTGNVMKRTQVMGERDSVENGETDDLITTMTYTQFGLIDTMTDPLGRVTDYDYNSRGLLTSVTYAVGTDDEATVAYEYDAAGNQTAMIDGEGNRTEYEYDALDRPTRIIEPDPDGAGPHWNHRSP